MLKVSGLGNNMVDKYMYIRTMCPGGSVLSFAVHAKIFEIEAGYLGVFGGDEATVHIYDTIRSLGLRSSHCRFYLGENGYAEIRLDNGGGVFIGSNRGEMLRKRPLELTVMDRAYITDYDTVHTSILSYIGDELSLIHQALSSISMDFSDRAGEEYLGQCAPYVGCASVSCGNMSRSEIEKQMALIRKFERGHIVIATRGVKGALVMVGGCLYEQSPCSVEAVDAMGTGDPSITCSLIDYVDAMRGSRDFPSASGAKRTVTAAGYQDLAVRTSLYRAAVYSADSCQKEGSLGFGKVFRYE